MNILMIGPRIVARTIDLLIGITGVYDRGSYAQGYLDGYKAGNDAR